MSPLFPMLEPMKENWEIIESTIGKTRMKGSKTLKIKEIKKHH